MIIRKTSALVEAGILAAIAVIFSLVGMYVPFLSLFTNILWPLPIILCGRRCGFKWSLLALLVAGLIVAALISPLHALSEVVVLGIIGLTMGECMRRQFSPLKILLLGSIAAFISFLLSIAIGYLLMQINVLEVFKQSMEEAFTMTEDIYRYIGIGAGQMEQMQEQTKQMLKMIMLILPGAMLMSAPVTVLANYWAARKVLSRLGDYYPWFPPFRTWMLPKWVLAPYGVALALLFFQKNQQEGLLYATGFNIFVVSNVLLIIQAMSLLYWYVKEKNKPKWMFSLGFTLLFVSQLFSQLAVMAGAYDLIFDFRKLRKRPQPTKEQEGKY